MNNEKSPATKKRLRRVGLSMLAVTALLFGLQSSGCTLLTEFTQHRIDRIASDSPAGISIHVSFGTSAHDQKCVPGIYDRRVYRDPFSCHFTVWGPIDSIKAIETEMSINGGDPISVSIDPATLNANRKLSHNGKPLFPLGKIPFPYTADEVKTVEFRTTMTAIVAGETKEVVINNEYEMTIRKETGNRFWSALMSV